MNADRRATSRTRCASRIFATAAEAQAFAEGVEMVNDSAIEDVCVRIISPSQFRVEWDDSDDSTEEDGTEHRITTPNLPPWPCLCGEAFASEADAFAHVAYAGGES